MEFEKLHSFNNNYELLRYTLITEVLPGTRKMERKEKPLKKSCQNPVEYVR